MSFAMEPARLCLWLLVCNHTIRTFAAGQTKPLYIGTFYGVDVSSKGWSSQGVMPAVQLALEHVNKDPSILPGYTLHQDWRDSKCDSGVAIRAMLDLVSKPPTKIMFTAPGCSPAAEPIAEAASFWGAVQIGFSNTSPLLSDHSRFPLFSRTSPSETINNIATLAVLKKFKWNRIAILVQNDNIFTKTKENLVALALNNNITLEFVESFNDDPSQSVLNIKRKNVRIIVGLMYEDKFRQTACKAFNDKIYGKKYVWILPGWYSDKWWKNTRDTPCSEHQIRQAAGNYLATRPLPLGSSTAATIAGKTAVELNDEMMTLVRRANLPSNGFASFAYDAIWSIALTLNQSSSVLEARNTSLLNVTYGNSETADLFRRVLRNLSFVGMSGHVKFNKYGDRETSIEVLQQQGDVMKVVGLLNFSSASLNESLFVWEGGKIPSDGMINRTEPFEPSKQETVVILVMSSVGILLSVGCLALNIIYRKHRVIKMSSPQFNNITAIGCFLCYMHVLLAAFGNSTLHIGENRFLCRARVTLIVFGFTFVFGGMLTKTWRVFKIFTNRRLKREIGGLRTVNLLLKFFYALLVDMIVLVSWELVDPIQSETIEISVKPHPDNEDIIIHTTAQQCTSKHYDHWTLAILAYKGVLLLFGVFLAWETRNVHYAELNDSKNIGVAVYNILLFSALSITAEFVLSDFRGKNIFNNSVIYVCATMVLCLVFVPKINRLSHESKVQVQEGENQARQNAFGNEAFTTSVIGDTEHSAR